MQFTNLFKKTVLFTIILFSVCFLFACKKDKKPNNNTTVEENYKPHVLDSTYYKDVNFKEEDDTKFIRALRKVTRDKHTTYTSYNEVRYHLVKTDKLDNGRLWGMYNGEEFAPKWTGGKPWNREHVWVNSRLGVPRVKGGERSLASDLHNLRVCNSDVNSARSNFYYVAKDENGNYFPDNAPAQNAGDRKYFPSYRHGGDAIRILLYMVLHYSELNIVENEPYGMVYKKEGAKIGNVKDFVYLLKKDPVDQFEINRNNRIAEIQGNRNPFIDHPEFAARVVKYFEKNQNKELNNTKIENEIKYFIHAVYQNQITYTQILTKN